MKAIGGGLIALFITCVVGLSLTACPQNPLVPPGDADATPNPNPVVVTTSTCGQACAEMRTLGCMEGFSADGGDTCEVVCQRTIGGTFDMKPSCIASQTSVAGVRSCKTVRCLGQP
jgi:hypothetical protein